MPSPHARSEQTNTLKAMRPHAPTLLGSTLHGLLALAGALALLGHTTFAQTWQTVDDFQYFAGKESFVLGLARNPLGNIFAAGDGLDAAGTYHALAMKTTDGGITWATIDNYSDPNSTSQYSGPGYDAGIVADPAGTLYVAGYDAGTSRAWFVRRSSDGGLTWSTVDSFILPSGLAEPRAMATDSAGNVYVTGAISGGSNTYHVIVRKGIPSGGGGMTWSTVDSNRVAFVDYGATGAVFCHPTAGVFVVGGSSARWIVRRSSDGGATWTTVDSYQLDSTSTLAAGAEGIGADSSGNLYAVGYAGKSVTQKPKNVSYEHWIVRKSSNGGSSWTTVDDFQPTSTGNAFANGFATDANGNFFVIGRQNSNDSTGDHWIVRKNLAGFGTWQTVDNFQYSNHAQGKSLLGDNAGNIFAAGWGYDANGTRHWVIRKGTP